MRVGGVVENMSWLVGTGQEIFGSGGGARLAAEVGAPLLAQIPLDPALREAADAGVPVLEAAPESDAAAALGTLAEAVQRSRPGAIRKPLTVL
jgi:ATP-binding protein involved in chromosome partitioning